MGGPLRPRPPEAIATGSGGGRLSRHTKIDGRLCARAAFPSCVASRHHAARTPRVAKILTATALFFSLVRAADPIAKMPRMDASFSLKVKLLSEFATLPKRGSALAAGYDLSASADCVVPARGKALVKTDLSMAIPTDCYGRIAPRSGLAWKNSIDTGAGVIDSDYRGEVKVLLFNHEDTDFNVKVGDRVAQLILERIATPEVIAVDDLDESDRGAGGFGSTGVSGPSGPSPPPEEPIQ